MGIKQIENAPGIPQRSYSKGYVFKCFGCNLWVRWLDDSELCANCMKARGIKRTIPSLTTDQAIKASNEE